MSSDTARDGAPGLSFRSPRQSSAVPPSPPSSLGRGTGPSFGPPFTSPTSSRPSPGGYAARAAAAAAYTAQRTQQLSTHPPPFASPGATKVLPSAQSNNRSKTPGPTRSLAPAHPAVSAQRALTPPARQPLPMRGLTSTTTPLPASRIGVPGGTSGSAAAATHARQGLGHRMGVLENAHHAPTSQAGIEARAFLATAPAGANRSPETAWATPVGSRNAPGPYSSERHTGRQPLAAALGRMPGGVTPGVGGATRTAAAQQQQQQQQQQGRQGRRKDEWLSSYETSSAAFLQDLESMLEDATATAQRPPPLSLPKQQPAQDTPLQGHLPYMGTGPLGVAAVATAAPGVAVGHVRGGAGQPGAEGSLSSLRTMLGLPKGSALSQGVAQQAAGASGAEAAGPGGSLQHQSAGSAVGQALPGSTSGARPAADALVYVLPPGTPDLGNTSLQPCSSGTGSSGGRTEAGPGARGGTSMQAPPSSPAPAAPQGSSARRPGLGPPTVLSPEVQPATAAGSDHISAQRSAVATATAAGYVGPAWPGAAAAPTPEVPPAAAAAVLAAAPLLPGSTLEELWGVLRASSTQNARLVAELEAAQRELQAAQERVEESEELMRAFQQQLAARQQQVSAWTAAIAEAERREEVAKLQLQALGQACSAQSTRAQQAETVAAATQLRLERILAQAAAAERREQGKSRQQLQQEEQVVGAEGGLADHPYGQGHAAADRTGTTAATTTTASGSLRAELAAAQVRATKAELEAAMARNRALVVKQELEAAQERSRAASAAAAALRSELDGTREALQLMGRDHDAVREAVAALRDQVQEKDGAVRRSTQVLLHRARGQGLGLSGRPDVGTVGVWRQEHPDRGPRQEPEDVRELGEGRQQPLGHAHKRAREAEQQHTQGSTSSDSGSQARGGEEASPSLATLRRELRQGQSFKHRQAPGEEPSGGQGPMLVRQAVQKYEQEQRHEQQKRAPAAPAAERAPPSAAASPRQRLQSPFDNTGAEAAPPDPWDTPGSPFARAAVHTSRGDAKDTVPFDLSSSSSDMEPSGTRAAGNTQVAGASHGRVAVIAGQGGASALPQHHVTSPPEGSARRRRLGSLLLVAPGDLPVEPSASSERYGSRRGTAHGAVGADKSGGRGGHVAGSGPMAGGNGGAAGGEGAAGAAVEEGPGPGRPEWAGNTPSWRNRFKTHDGTVSPQRQQAASTAAAGAATTSGVRPMDAGAAASGVGRGGVGAMGATPAREAQEVAPSQGNAAAGSGSRGSETSVNAATSVRGSIGAGSMGGGSVLVPEELLPLSRAPSRGSGTSAHGSRRRLVFNSNSLGGSSMRALLPAAAASPGQGLGQGGQVQVQVQVQAAGAVTVAAAAGDPGRLHEGEEGAGLAGAAREQAGELGERRRQHGGEREPGPDTAEPSLADMRRQLAARSTSVGKAVAGVVGSGQSVASVGLGIAATAAAATAAVPRVASSGSEVASPSSVSLSSFLNTARSNQQQQREQLQLNRHHQNHQDEQQQQSERSARGAHAAHAQPSPFPLRGLPGRTGAPGIGPSRLLLRTASSPDAGPRSGSTRITSGVGMPPAAPEHQHNLRQQQQDTLVTPHLPLPLVPSQDPSTEGFGSDDSPVLPYGNDSPEAHGSPDLPYDPDADLRTPRDLSLTPRSRMLDPSKVDSHRVSTSLAASSAASSMAGLPGARVGVAVRDGRAGGGVHVLTRMAAGVMPLQQQQQPGDVVLPLGPQGPVLRRIATTPRQLRDGDDDGQGTVGGGSTPRWIHGSPLGRTAGGALAGGSGVTYSPRARNGVHMAAMAGAQGRYIAAAAGAASAPGRRPWWRRLLGRGVGGGQVSGSRRHGHSLASVGGSVWYECMASVSPRAAAAAADALGSPMDPGVRWGATGASPLAGSPAAPAHALVRPAGDGGEYPASGGSSLQGSLLWCPAQGGAGGTGLSGASPRSVGSLVGARGHEQWSPRVRAATPGRQQRRYGKGGPQWHGAGDSGDEDGEEGSEGGGGVKEAVVGALLHVCVWAGGVACGVGVVLGLAAVLERPLARRAARRRAARGVVVDVDAGVYELWERGRGREGAVGGGGCRV